MTKSATTGGKTFTFNSEEETKTFAAALAKKIRPPKVIALFGNLGAGKTVFAKGFARGLGIRERKIKSPTFLMIHEHVIARSEAPKQSRFFHCDLYRIKKLDPFMKEQLQELFRDKKAIVLIEWGERAEKILPTSAIRIIITTGKKDERKITAKNLPNL